MVPDPSKTCLGMEYFCTKGDGLWTMSDTELLDLASSELVSLGLAKEEDVEDGLSSAAKALPSVRPHENRKHLAVTKTFYH